MREKICHNPTCHNILTGKQRRWCSDACRKQAARLHERVRKSRPVMKGNRPGLSGYYGDHKGQIRYGEMRIEFRLVQTVEALGAYDPVNHLRMYEFRLKLAQIIEAEMNGEVFGHVVTVTVHLK